MSTRESEADRSNNPAILIVDDQPSKLLTLKVILTELGESILTACSAREALAQLLKNDDVAVILLDVVMPGLDGFELATMIREHPRFYRTAIIFVSAIQITDPDRLRGYAVGAVDYVPVPVVPELLRAKVRVFVDLYRKTRELERLNLELERRVAERTEELAAAATMLRRSAAAAGFANFDISEAAILVSDNFRTLWDLEPEAVCNHGTMLKRVHPDDREKLSEKWSTVSRSGGTYHIEFRIIRSDGSIRWLEERGESETVGSSIRITGVHLDVTERRRAEEHQKILMLEVDHRSKNALAVVQSVVRMSEAATPAALIEVVGGRVAALARAHTLLARDRWQGADISAIVQEELAPFMGENRVFLSGLPVHIRPSAVQPLSMIIHELTTNAAKYGALSVSRGLIEITWDFSTHSSELHIGWKERNGPPVSGLPQRRGFGSRLMSANAKSALGGRFEERWETGGLEFEMWVSGEVLDAESARLQKRVEPDGVSEALPQSSNVAQVSVFPGLRILVVEDEPLIAMEITDQLRRHGCTIVGTAANLKSAVRFASESAGDIDGVILDLNLGGELTIPVADMLARQGVPMIWITGYGTLPDGVKVNEIDTVLQKPFAASALEAGLQKVSLLRGVVSA